MAAIEGIIIATFLLISAFSLSGFRDRARMFLKQVVGTAERVNITTAEIQKQIWSSLVAFFYNRLPTERGELDHDLKQDIQDHLLFVGVRFKTFNGSVSRLAADAMVFTVIAFIIVFIFGILTIMSDLIPNLIILSVLFVFGIMILFGLLFISAADILFFLYNITGEI